jgi:hypothetical protein
LQKEREGAGKWGFHYEEKIMEEYEMKLAGILENLHEGCLTDLDALMQIHSLTESTYAELSS